MPKSMKAKKEIDWNAAQRSRLISAVMFITVFIAGDAAFFQGKETPGATVLLLICSFVVVFFVRMAIHEKIEGYCRKARW